MGIGTPPISCFFWAIWPSVPTVWGKSSAQIATVFWNSALERTSLKWIAQVYATLICPLTWRPGKLYRHVTLNEHEAEIWYIDIVIVTKLDLKMSQKQRCHKCSNSSVWHPHVYEEAEEKEDQPKIFQLWNMIMHQSAFLSCSQTLFLLEPQTVIA